MSSSDYIVDSASDLLRADGLLTSQSRLIVAVSGGADSVALLAVLLQLGYDCVAAHCNFHLRGSESQRDMRHVEALCRQLGVDLVVRDFDVEARCSQTGESVEMACRALRYQWFEDLLDSQRAAAVAVGHHREDNVETVLLNMLRGTGPTGLCGMRYRNGNVIRPLLNCKRADIENYLSQHQLSFVVDSSNNSNNFKRNRLRNIVIPELERCFDGASDAILRTAARVAQSQRLYQALVADRAALYRHGDRIDLARLSEAEGSNAAMLLFEMLYPEGFNMPMVENMIASAGASGLRFESKVGITAELSRGVLYLTRPMTTTGKVVKINLKRDILTPVHLQVNRLGRAEFNPQRDHNTVYFDAAVADGDDLWLRHWRRGDRLEPFGMRGSRLVSDLFAEAKYTAEQKRQAWLLCKGDKILWVIGLRASRHFPVTDRTSQVIRLRLI